MPPAEPDHPELDPPFDIVVAPGETRAPFVFNSPHSGTIYPRALLDLTRLDAHALRRSEDTFVDDLFSGCAAVGIPLLRARFPRAFVDVNREPYELDPTMFDGRLPAYANTRTMRVAGGLGTIARIVADNEEIYTRPLPVKAALRRIERYYKPYHGALANLLDRTADIFGAVALIDCHSMPSQHMAREERPRPDIVLGDRYGTSCAGFLADVVQETMQDLGYSVARNRPYAGGYITERYGDPRSGRHALQIEINRALYMDERRLTRNNGYRWLKRDLAKLAETLVTIPADRLKPVRMAAE